jgi:hypothetical protein
MATSSYLFTTGYIAGQIKQSHEDTLKILKHLNFKPIREVRTEKRTMRQWHKDAMYAAMAYIEDKKKAREEVEVAPVQAELDLNAALGIEQFKVPHPSLDITVMETKHAEEMLSVLRSIDQRLYELTVIWSK